MTINQYVQKYLNRDKIPPVICADGFHMSVGVGVFYFSRPRNCDAEEYTHMGIEFPSDADPLILEYAYDKDHPTETFYIYVPVDLIDAVIAKHGGARHEN